MLWSDWKRMRDRAQSKSFPDWCMQQVAKSGSSGSCNVRKSATPEEPVAKPRMYRQRSAIPLQRSNLYAKRQPQQQQQQQQLQQLQLHQHQQQHEQQSLTPSPLFNIRYKSMTNLLAADSGNSIRFLSVIVSINWPLTARVWFVNPVRFRIKIIWTDS